MAPHDSDSSGDEQEDYTETNVLLGYASKEPEDISRLGGRPVMIPFIHSFIISRYLYLRITIHPSNAAA